MSIELNRDWLCRKFQEIKLRTVKALDQLQDEEINSSPDPSCHSISTLILHIHGNVQERILRGILQQEVERGNPWETAYMTCTELVQYIQTDMDTVINTVNSLKPDQWLHTQTVRNRERTHLDMLHQCAAHYSEHMGQILYLTKWLRKEQYLSTSI